MKFAKCRLVNDDDGEDHEEYDNDVIVVRAATRSLGRWIVYIP